MATAYTRSSNTRKITFSDTKITDKALNDFIWHIDFIFNGNLTSLNVIVKFGNLNSFFMEALSEEDDRFCKKDEVISSMEIHSNLHNSSGVICTLRVLFS